MVSALKITCLTLSTSAQSIADIAFFDDFVFWVALHDGQVTILSFMVYGILLHDLS